MRCINCNKILIEEDEVCPYCDENNEIENLEGFSVLEEDEEEDTKQQED